jgi:Tfp pilus assembly PilM family ATPase
MASPWTSISGLFARRSGSAIGVDIGSAALRAIQLERVGGADGVRLVAQSELDVEQGSMAGGGVRLVNLAGQFKELMAGATFSGRRVVLGLPAWSLSLLHVRVPLLQGAALKAAVEAEAMQKLAALGAGSGKLAIRYAIAGQVSGGRGGGADKGAGGSDAKLEAVVMACPMQVIEAVISAAESARFEVVDVTAPQRAILALSTQFYRRKEEREANVMYVDVGSEQTRVMIARTLAGGQLMFARTIEVGARQVAGTVTKAAGKSLEEALRAWSEYDQSLPSESGSDSREREGVAPAAAGRTLAGGADENSSFALLGAARPLSPPPLPMAGGAAGPVAAALTPVVAKLAAELDMCRRYFESLPVSGSGAVDRVMLAGALAGRRSIGHHLCQRLSIPVAVADPLSRLKGLDPGGGAGDAAQPQWTVAAGLSLLDPVISAAGSSASREAVKEAA